MTQETESEFETVEVDLTDDQQANLVEAFVTTRFSAPSVATFKLTRQIDTLEKALFSAVINEILLEALAECMKDEETPPNE